MHANWGFWRLAIQLAVAAFSVSPLATAAHEDYFAARCERLASQTKIQVLFEDREVYRDYSRSVEVLKKLARFGANDHHSVLGLTHAAPAVTMNLKALFLSDTDGQVCAVPSLTVKLGFSEFQVYLARELGNACRRRIVYEHEDEHVAVWRTHLRAGAQMLTLVLQRNLAHPFYFNSRAEADAVLLPQIKAQFSPLLRHLTEGIGAAQKEIDSPASYARVESRLRACP